MNESECQSSPTAILRDEQLNDQITNLTRQVEESLNISIEHNTTVREELTDMADNVPESTSRREIMLAREAADVGVRVADVKQPAAMDCPDVNTEASNEDAKDILPMSQRHNDASGPEEPQVKAEKQRSVSSSETAKSAP